MDTITRRTGLGVSKGRAKGIAKYHDDKTFKEGDILISDMTTPDNVPQMKLASGIITNQGSITCHASIVSRELGKPCMVSYIRHNLDEEIGSMTTVNELVGLEVELIINGMQDAYVTFQGVA